VSERLTKIGKYEVECVIGEGAMGVVYRAVDPLINRRVAIKVMTDAMAQDTALRERFLREAQAAGSLQHPNLVTIYDFGEIDDHLYIAMEYVEGDDLSELLRKRLPIPVDQALDLVIGLLHGLSFAHKRGIVHRDIKPANIRVDDEGRARLMDFGVAHLASSEMTSTGMLLGTPSYMAPEQITGSPVFPETDIFSVGAVLYELISHHRPFESDTLQSLMYAILYKVPESLDDLVPGLPAGLNRVVMKALEKEHQNRYKTALAMANDLAAIRDSIDTSGRRTTTSLRATIDTALAGERKARRRRRRARRAVLSAVGLVAAAGLFVAGRQMSRRVEAHQTATMAMANSLSASRRTVPDSAASSVATPPAATARQTNSVSVEQNAQLDSRSRTAVSDPSTSRLRANDRTAAGGAVRPPVQTATREAPAVAPAPNVASQQTATQQSAAAQQLATQQLATQQLTTQQPAPQQPAPQQLPLASPPTVSQLVPAPAVESRESAAAQIATVVAAYARALESRDIDELARVYPTMSSSQRGAFEDFFRSTRSLRASLTVGGLQVDGPSADAQLNGSFDYITSAGVPEHRPVSFRAALRRDGTVWKLVAVR
jgi:serine/threonine-protein kinase